LEKDGKTYYWCKHCKWGRGTWTTHKSADHDHDYWKKKRNKDSKDKNEETGSGFLVMDLIEGGFLAVDIL